MIYKKCIFKLYALCVMSIFRKKIWPPHTDPLSYRPHPIPKALFCADILWSGIQQPPRNQWTFCRKSYILFEAITLIFCFRAINLNIPGSQQSGRDCWSRQDRTADRQAEARGRQRWPGPSRKAPRAPIPPPSGPDLNVGRWVYRENLSTRTLVCTFVVIDLRLALCLCLRLCEGLFAPVFLWGCECAIMREARFFFAAVFPFFFFVFIKICIAIKRKKGPIKRRDLEWSSWKPGHPAMFFRSNSEPREVLNRHWTHIIGTRH